MKTGHYDKISLPTQLLRVKYETKCRACSLVNAYLMPLSYIKSLTWCSQPHTCAQTPVPSHLKHSRFYKSCIFFDLHSLRRETSWNAFMYGPRSAFKANNHYSEKDFLSFLFCVKKANLVNYSHLVHKVIILMLFTSMLKICSLVKMKVTLISPKAFFHLVMYIA